MTPQTLTLTGFTGIRKGLGLKTVTVDLTAVDGSLIALVGPNGRGKTTILDNLHPYRLMPFRAKGYTARTFSFYDQVDGDGGKDLIWEHEGVLYRSALVFKGANKTQKTEAYLFQYNGSGWDPAITADGLTSDGKTNTYDSQIESILGHPQLFFSSVFSAQGSKTLDSAGAGETKELMGELLGVNHLLKLAERARRVKSILMDRLASTRSAKDRINELEGRIGSNERALPQMRADLFAKTAEEKAAMRQLMAANAKLAEEDSALQESIRHDIRRHELTQLLRGIAGRKERGEEDARSRITSAGDRAARADSECSETLRLIKERRAEIAVTKATTTSRLSQRAEIKQAEDSLPALNADLATAKLKVSEIRGRKEDVAERLLRLGTIEASIGEIKERGTAVAAELAGLRHRSTLLETVPCSGGHIHADQCKLLCGARQDRDLVPQVSAKREDLLAQYLALKSEKETLDSDIKLLQSELALELFSAENAMNRAQRARDEAFFLASLAATLDQAEEMLRVLADDEARLTAQEDAAQSKAESEKRLALVEADEIRADLEIKREEWASESAAIELQIEEIPTGNTAAVDQARIAQEQAEKQHAAAQRSSRDLSTRVTQTEAEISADIEQLKTLESERELITTLEGEIAHWDLLAKCLGKDGIIALTIDDAGPQLSSLANDLLLRTFGPRFSLSIRTQREKADGDLAETFKIVVFDGEADGEEAPLEAMSGGERIWINRAIAMAIALFHGAASGRNYGTLFTDEADGALDPARKRHFMTLKRAMIDIGGFNREIFISHTPELQDMADATIRVEELAGDPV
ncbi:MAG: hypothetical protein COX57_02255 [Alphaproteobacteria bacterium CG_4_10_14_0_2_um_filter_63_37]|nr:MAG: hypothetical protein AUJ55_08400 [Proteobacteria bacterium CG1_02_64_396]PJA25644.1 MAG: hypothetical protein COX57_02255 [Alphaproteobacteria bacterium CG_4_10_14_0_2_um_filter_63_37]